MKSIKAFFYMLPPSVSHILTGLDKMPLRLLSVVSLSGDWRESLSLWSDNVASTWTPQAYRER